MIEITIEFICVMFYLILGVISLSTTILKAKTQVYVNCISLIANFLFMISMVFVENYMYVSLGLVYVVMCIYGIIKFGRLWKNAP